MPREEEEEEEEERRGRGGEEGGGEAEVDGGAAELSMGAELDKYTRLTASVPGNHSSSSQLQINEAS